MQEIVLSIVLAAHLLATNLACAGPLFCIWLRTVDSLEDSLADELGSALAWLSVAAFVLGMLIGIGWLILAPSPGLHAALDRFPSRAFWFGGVELLFSLACLVLYATCWRRFADRRWILAAVAMLSTTNLFHHFPPLMSVIGKLASDPSWAAGDVFERPALLRLMLRSEIMALTVHFVLASVAVAGIAVLWRLSRCHRDFAAPDVHHVARRAALSALVASFLQLPVGVWLVIALPGDSRGALMGDDPVASLLLLGGLFAAMLLLQRLAGIALGDVKQETLRSVGWLLIVVVVFMSATLRTSRSDVGRNRLASATQTASQELPARLSVSSETASATVNSLGDREATAYRPCLLRPCLLRPFSSSAPS